MVIHRILSRTTRIRRHECHDSTRPRRVSKSWYDAEEEFADDAEEESLPIGIDPGIDPISGKAVGKATAIIAADANNHVFYFEKEAKVNKANAKLREK